MAACVGASATGSRAFTATSSQGLALMHEMLHHAAGGRLPIVMLNANRALSPPWNLYCDHTDSLSQRDTGWTQYYCSDVQDVMDSTLIAYRVAEKVMLPVMINLDGFYLTHTSEVIDIPEQEQVDRFLPPYDPVDKVDVENPSAYGCVCGADLFSSLKFRRQRDTLAVEQAWLEASAEFAAPIRTLPRPGAGSSLGRCRGDHRDHRHCGRRGPAGRRHPARRGHGRRQPELGHGASLPLSVLPPGGERSQAPGGAGP